MECNSGEISVLGLLGRSVQSKLLVLLRILRSRSAAVLFVLLLANAGLLASRMKSAPLDEHSWRQTLAGSVARNYVCGQTFFSPRVDCCGEGPRDGVVPMEFPLYAWIASLLAPLVGLSVAFGGLNLLAASAFLIGIFLMARRAMEGLGAFPSLFAATAGSSLLLFSPVFQQWAGAWLPDNFAWGFSVLAAGCLAAWPPLTWRGLIAPTVAVSLGVLSKTIAWPMVALTSWLVMGGPTRLHQKRWRAVLAGLIHAAVVVGVWLSWYRGWNLWLSRAANCEVFALETPRLEQIPQLLTNRESWEEAMRRFEALLGPTQLASAIGAVTALGLSPRLAFGFLAQGAGALGIFLLLGWHTRVHGYDSLLFVVTGALGLAAIAGVFAWILERFRCRRPSIVRGVAFITLAAGVGILIGVLRPKLNLGPERNVSNSLAHELDLLTPPGQPFIASFARADPRPSFFSARRVWSPARPAELCEPERRFRYDCADQQGFASFPCNGQPRWNAAVFFPKHTLLCGLQDEEALERLSTRLLSTLSPGAVVNRPAPGLGLLLGFDASWDQQPHIDAFISRSETLTSGLSRVGLAVWQVGATERYEAWATLEPIHQIYQSTPSINVLRFQLPLLRPGSWSVRLLHPSASSDFDGLSATVILPSRDSIEGAPYRLCADRADY